MQEIYVKDRDVLDSMHGSIPSIIMLSHLLAKVFSYFRAQEVGFCFGNSSLNLVCLLFFLFCKCSALTHGSELRDNS